MRANMQKVIDAFRAGVAATGDRKNTCSTDGTIVYSYKMPIAMRNRHTVTIVPREDGPSRTTRAQIDALAMALDNGQFRTIVRKSLGPVPNVPTGGSAFQR